MENRQHAYYTPELVNKPEKLRKEHIDEKCVFCDIANNKIPAHIFYNTEEHMAFLDMYPTTPGQSLVITKRHYESDIFKMPEDELNKFMIATKNVAGKITSNLKAERVFAVFEGVEINHAHIKLYPVYNIVKKVASEETRYSGDYQGFITTLHGPQAKEVDLDLIKKLLNG
jgi:diadenosine tetraphosphate (Ap4A) HIT family hydrolase